MAHIPEVLPTDNGRVELATAIPLPSGRFLRDAVNFDPKNLMAIADSLEDWVASRTPEKTYPIGDDIVTFRYGGTDQAPQMIIFNHREKGGSVATSFHSAAKIAARLRTAAKKYNHNP